MFHPDHITSLTDFQRNTAKYMKLIKKTKQPLLLTVRGKAKLIVSDAATAAMPQPQRIARTPKEIAARLKEAERDRSQAIDAEAVFAQIRKQFIEPWRKKAKATRRKAS